MPTTALGSAVVSILVASGQAAQGTVCNDQWAKWSPDGRSVVFTSDRTGDPEIFLLNVATRTTRQLTNVPGRDAHPSFSPDGRRIAFQSPRGDGHTNLYTMNVEGSDLRKLTTHQGFAGVPVWSDDGRTIAYQWTPKLQAEKWRLMLLDPGSGRTRQITDGAANDQVPNWSRDGALVFYSDRAGTNQVYVRSAQGDVRRLTSTAFDERGGVWSPDGRQIAFMSTRDGSPPGIFVMNADGTGVRRIGTIAMEHGDPFFSPDGQRLLVSPPVDGGRQIWSLSIADGRHEVLSTCRR